MITPSDPTKKRIIKVIRKTTYNDEPPSISARPLIEEPIQVERLTNHCAVSAVERGSVSESQKETGSSSTTISSNSLKPRMNISQAIAAAKANRIQEGTKVTNLGSSHQSNDMNVVQESQKRVGIEINNNEKTAITIPAPPNRVYFAKRSVPLTYNGFSKSGLVKNATFEGNSQNGINSSLLVGREVGAKSVAELADRRQVKMILPQRLQVKEPINSVSQRVVQVNIESQAFATVPSKSINEKNTKEVVNKPGQQNDEFKQKNALSQTVLVGGTDYSLGFQKSNFSQPIASRVEVSQRMDNIPDVAKIVEEYQRVTGQNIIEKKNTNGKKHQQESGQLNKKRGFSELIEIEESMEAEVQDQQKSNFNRLLGVEVDGIDLKKCKKQFVESLAHQFAGNQVENLDISKPYQSIERDQSTHDQRNANIINILNESSLIMYGGNEESIPQTKIQEDLKNKKVIDTQEVKSMDAQHDDFRKKEIQEKYPHLITHRIQTETTINRMKEGSNSSILGIQQSAKKTISSNQEFLQHVLGRQETRKNVSNSSSFDDLFEEKEVADAQVEDIQGSFEKQDIPCLIEVVDFEKDEYLVGWKSYDGKSQKLSKIYSFEEIKKNGGDIFLLFLEKFFKTSMKKNNQKQQQLQLVEQQQEEIIRTDQECQTDDILIQKQNYSMVDEELPSTQIVTIQDDQVDQVQKEQYILEEKDSSKMNTIEQEEQITTEEDMQEKEQYLEQQEELIEDSKVILDNKLNHLASDLVETINQTLKKDVIVEDVPSIEFGLGIQMDIQEIVIIENADIINNNSTLVQRVEEIIQNHTEVEDIQQEQIEQEKPTHFSVEPIPIEVQDNNQSNEQIDHIKIQTEEQKLKEAIEFVDNLVVMDVILQNIASASHLEDVQSNEVDKQTEQQCNIVEQVIGDQPMQEIAVNGAVPQVGVETDPIQESIQISEVIEIQQQSVEETVQVDESIQKIPKADLEAIEVEEQQQQQKEENQVEASFIEEEKTEKQAENLICDESEKEQSQHYQQIIQLSPRNQSAQKKPHKASSHHGKSHLAAKKSVSIDPSRAQLLMKQYEETVGDQSVGEQQEEEVEEEREELLEDTRQKQPSIEEQYQQIVKSASALISKAASYSDSIILLESSVEVGTDVQQVNESEQMQEESMNNQSVVIDILNEKANQSKSNSSNATTGSDQVETKPKLGLFNMIRQKVFPHTKPA